VCVCASIKGHSCDRLSSFRLLINQARNLLN